MPIRVLYLAYAYEWNYSAGFIKPCPHWRLVADSIVADFAGNGDSRKRRRLSPFLCFCEVCEV